MVTSVTVLTNAAEGAAERGGRLFGQLSIPSSVTAATTRRMGSLGYLARRDSRKFRTQANRWLEIGPPVRFGKAHCQHPPVARGRVRFSVHMDGIEYVLEDRLHFHKVGLRGDEDKVPYRVLLRHSHNPIVLTTTVVSGVIVSIDIL